MCCDIRTLMAEPVKNHTNPDEKCRCVEDSEVAVRGTDNNNNNNNNNIITRTYNSHYDNSNPK